MDVVTIPVNGLNANTVTKALKAVRGVHGVDIDLYQNVATVTFDETEANIAHLEQVVADTCHHRG